MYVIYDKRNTALVTNPATRVTHYKTISAAKAALTRMSKRYQKRAGSQSRYARFEEYQLNKDPQFVYAIAESAHYEENIVEKVERVNLMNGERYMESVNTPNHMSPASETYWSM